MPGELRDRDGTKEAVVRSLNCLIDPHHSCVRHMSPIFPKRKFCEAWSLKQAAWGHGGGGQKEGPSQLCPTLKLLLAWCWGAGRWGSSTCPDSSDWEPRGLQGWLWTKPAMPGSGGKRQGYTCSDLLSLSASGRFPSHSSCTRHLLPVLRSHMGPRSLLFVLSHVLFPLWRSRWFEEEIWG